MFRKDFCRREPILSVLVTNDDSDSTSSTSTVTDVFDDDEEDEEGRGRDDKNGDEAPRSPLVPDSYSQPAHQQRNDDENQSDQLKGKVALLRKKLQEMTRRNKMLMVALMKKSRTDDGRECDENEQAATYSSSDNENFKSQIMRAISNVSERQTRWSTKRTSMLVAQTVWAHAGFLPEFLKLSRKYFREKIFTTFNILREMDLAGGTLSYEGIDVLRRVESGGHQRMRGCMIPSKSEIKRMAGMVEWFARPLCPFTLRQISKGESVEFDYAKTTICILRAFHLDEVGKKRSLSIASSIDGGSLSKNLSIIAGGIKVTDRAARCPVTSKPLLDNPTTMKAQSRNLCIPLKIMMGRETKETFTEFGPLFQFIDNLSETNTLPIEMAGYEPFRCMINCDLSAQRKGLCKGGAAKVHTLPCTGCATESESLATPNSSLCTRWCSKRSPDTGWMCFHKPMGTHEHVTTMKTEVAELITTMHCDLEVIQARSTISVHDVELDNPLQSSTRNATSIHFLPTNTREKQLFSQLLSNELILRGLCMRGSMDCRREILREALQREATVARLAKEIAHGDVKEGAYFLLMHTLPCVLHMENRNGIKLLTMVIIEGLSNAKKNRCIVVLMRRV